MSKKQKKIIALGKYVRTDLWNCAECKRHAHHGRLSSGRILHRVGCYLRTIPDRRIHVHQKNPE